MQRLAITLMLAFMLGGCTVPCYQLTATEGQVICEDQYFSCSAGWKDGPPPAGLVCR